MDSFPTETDTLDHPVRETEIEELYRAAFLTPQARDAAIDAIQRTRHWWLWADRSLLFVGSALLLAGVVFFFAYNWTRMPAIAKFSVIEVGLWVCAIGAIQRGLSGLTGKVLLLAASVFIGALLAVYGQVYQTGADNWAIYAIWALLMLPWASIGRFNALWMLWLVVTNVAWLLFWFQMQPLEAWDFPFGICLLLGLWNAAALVVREYGTSRGVDWIGGRWARHIILLATLVYWIIPTIGFIVDPETGNGSLAGLCGLVIALGVSHTYYRLRQPDLLCLGFNVLAGCVVLLTLVGKLMFEVSEDAGMFLFFGLIVLGVSSAAAFYLRNVARSLPDAER